MSDTRIAVLTPPGSGAIAVLAVRGPAAWAAFRTLFRKTGDRPLPDEAPDHGVWFGRLGDQGSDEVIVSAHSGSRFEIHCHGGRQVVNWALDLFRGRGITPGGPPDRAGVEFADPAAGALVPFARTVRTAAILLDQAHGAYARAVREAEPGSPAAEEIERTLRRNVRVGGHLVEPWRVAIAGAPNAGKSSLLNALAGFARSVVSPIPGTTRDAISVSAAFDGWPVDLLDTAGIRDPADVLEREGIDRARAGVAGSDLVLWVVDASGPRPGSVAEIAEPLGVPVARVIVIFNKTDIAEIPPGELHEAPRVSATTGSGVPELVTRIASALVPVPPAPGDPVPYTPAEIARWS
ncbi:MAG TPA: GTPase [Gemmataceae bacterium]|nr:GTPase [Gemmataceae bacterium]